MASPVTITFLGGLGEIGRNCMVFEQDDQLLEQPADALRVRCVARDVDLVSANEDLHRKGSFDHPQQLVALAQQSHHEVVARDQDLDRGARIGRRQLRAA